MMHIKYGHWWWWRLAGGMNLMRHRFAYNARQMLIRCIEIHLCLCVNHVFLSNWIHLRMNTPADSQFHLLLFGCVRLQIVVVIKHHAAYAKHNMCKMFLQTTLFVVVVAVHVHLCEALRTFLSANFLMQKPFPFTLLDFAVFFFVCLFCCRAIESAGAGGKYESSESINKLG